MLSTGSKQQGQNIRVRTVFLTPTLILDLLVFFHQVCKNRYYFGKAFSLWAFMGPLCTSHLYPRPPAPPIGMGGDNYFTFQSPGISPALWGQADGYNPALSPTLHNRKSHRGKGPNVKPPAIPRHCGDNQKVMALHLSPAIPVVDTNDWCISPMFL